MICIDPGHGGRDSGAVCKGFAEKVLNLELARLLLADCSRRLRRAFLTRHSDYYLSSATRRAIADDAGADLLLSIHHNAARSAAARGFELFYAGGAGERIAKVVHKAAAPLMATFDLPDRGVRHESLSAGGRLDVLHCHAPAALLEVCFITNAEDQRALKHGLHAALAPAICAGLDEVVSSFRA